MFVEKHGFSFANKAWASNQGDEESLGDQKTHAGQPQPNDDRASRKPGLAPLVNQILSASENDPILGDYSICDQCAKEKKGRPPSFPVTCWIGTCIVCNEIKSCCHVRDYGWPEGKRPKKELDKPDISLTATGPAPVRTTG